MAEIVKHQRIHNGMLSATAAKPMRNAKRLFMRLTMEVTVEVNMEVTSIQC